MYQVFNMGHLLEVYTDETTAASLIALAAEYKIPAQVIGRVEDSASLKLTISSGLGQFEYTEG
jgi:phosphoribosylformylglycinamidine cyclo-ligase